MKQRISLFTLVVLACLWFVPQAQAQFYHPYYGGTDIINRANFRVDMMVARECAQPYPPSYCLGLYQQYGPRYSGFPRIGRRDGLGRALDIAERIATPILAYKYGQEKGRLEGLEREQEYESRRPRETEPESAREQEQRGLIPMVNKTLWLAVIYDGDKEVGRLGPRERGKFPEPRHEYRAELRVAQNGRIEYQPALVAHNRNHTGWRIALIGAEEE